MTILSNQQLQYVISELETAYSWHDLWYKDFVKKLITRILPKNTTLIPDAHLKCPFGQWYQKKLIAQLHDEPRFSELIAKHEKMHNLATALLQRIFDDLPIPLSDWEQFQAVLDDMRLNLQSLQQVYVKMFQGRDPLTGAQNRAIMESDLCELHELVQRGVTTCALAMLDLDHFKYVNDNFGHSAGDSVLVSIIQCVKATMRPYDQIYRYGGEEFVICMPGVTSNQARKLAERIREIIASQSIRLEDSDQYLQVTASIGVSMHLQSRSIKESVARADKAMYEAKKLGRNRVVVDAKR